MDSREFDRFADSYDELLKDPARDLFAPGDPIFFHVRKQRLILDYLRRRKINARTVRYLDVGCGKGQLASLLGPHLGQVAGCDFSPKMMEKITGFEARVQKDPNVIPFEDGGFDLVTAVCVYHHVRVSERPALTREIARVLRPGGTCCIIEHNPYNPVTRLIVSRTPVDGDAVLLRPREVHALQEGAGLRVRDRQFFLYLPGPLFRGLGFLEVALRKVPLGGQYAVFAQSAEPAARRCTE